MNFASGGEGKIGEGLGVGVENHFLILDGFDQRNGETIVGNRIGASFGIVEDKAGVNSGNVFGDEPKVEIVGAIFAIRDGFELVNSVAADGGVIDVVFVAEG